MTHAPILGIADLLAPPAAAAVFVLLMSRLREPARRRGNAVLLAGAGGVYLSGGFGPWELILPALIGGVAYLGLESHRWIGAGWLLHCAADLAHHLWGSPIWPFMPTSSFGCLVFDAGIAIWFLAGAPAVLGGASPAGSPPGV